MARNPQQQPGSVDEGWLCAPISTAIFEDPDLTRRTDLRKQGGSIGWSNFTTAIAYDRPDQPQQTIAVAAGTDYVINGVSQTNNGFNLVFNFPSSVNTTVDFSGFDHLLIVFDRDAFTVWEIYDARRVGPNNWTSRHVCVYDGRGALHTPPGATFEPIANVDPNYLNRPDVDNGSRGRRFGNGGAGLPQGCVPTRSMLEAAMAANGDFGCSLALWMDNSQKGHTSADSVPNPTANNRDWNAVAWPAFANDSNSASANTGSIRQGSVVYLPSTVNVETQPISPEAKVFWRTAQNLGFVTKEGAGGGNKIHVAANTGEDAFTSAQASAVNASMPLLFDTMVVASIEALQPSYFTASGPRTKGGGSTLVPGASMPEDFSDSPGQAQITLAEPQVAAVAEQRFIALGAISAPVVTLGASGGVTAAPPPTLVEGSAPIVLAEPRIAASGTSTPPAYGTLTLEEVAPSVELEETIGALFDTTPSGSAALTVPFPTLAATGTSTDAGSTVIGTAALSTAAPTAASSGSISVTGTSAVAPPAVTVTSAGVVGVDVTVDADLEALAYRHHGIWGPYWVGGASTGYKLVGGSDGLRMLKSTNKGVSWAEVDAGDAPAITTHGVTIACWFDQQTPGDSGTLFHIVFGESSGTDTVKYVQFETATDQWASTVTVTTISFFESQDSDLSITKARGGNLLVTITYNGGDNVQCHRSTDGGGAWAATGEPPIARFDRVRLLPGYETDDQDIWGLIGDVSADDLLLSVFDDSAGTWGAATALDTAIANPATTPSSFYFDAFLDTAQQKLAWFAWSAFDNGTADLRCGTYAVGGTAVALTNVVSNQDHSGYVGAMYDPINADWYCAYAGNGTEAIGALHIRWKRSPDQGATWEDATQYSVAVSDVKGISGGWMSASGGRWMPAWIDDANDDAKVASGNDVELAA